MPDQTARLALPFLLPAQAQKHVTHNEGLERLDLLVQLVVEAFDITTPPSLPQEGQVWALGLAPSGGWVGQGGRLAGWANGGWVFITPQAGWRAAQGIDLRVFDGTDWRAPLPALDNLPGLGVNTSHDATNRLSVSADATLLSHDGAGHQVKINKSATSETASLLFQTGWSGRAEMGTAGNDDFSVKVSPDGTIWHEGITVAAVNGAVSLPNGAQISGQISGTAVTQSGTDTTAGRLIRAQDGYVRGSVVGSVAQSGGVPTGAILERGSTVNGDYVRYADGTQICWLSLGPAVACTTAEGSLYRSTSTIWTLPVAFSGSDYVVHAAPQDDLRWASARPDNVAQARFVMWAPASDADSSACALMAIGRWF